MYLNLSFHRENNPLFIVRLPYLINQLLLPKNPFHKNFANIFLNDNSNNQPTEEFL